MQARRPIHDDGRRCPDRRSPRRSADTRVMLLALAMALVAAGRPPVQSSLHYRLEGIMSGPIDLTLDLNSGRFTLQEARKPRSDAIVRAAGRLGAGTTLRLRRQAQAAVARGLVTGACRRAKVPQPPVADAIRAMTITIDGRQTVAPDSIPCWSKAADDIAGAAYASVRTEADGRAARK